MSDVPFVTVPRSVVDSHWLPAQAKYARNASRNVVEVPEDKTDLVAWLALNLEVPVQDGPIRRLSFVVVDRDHAHGAVVRPPNRGVRRSRSRYSDITMSSTFSCGGAMRAGAAVRALLPYLSILLVLACESNPQQTPLRMKIAKSTF